MPANWNLIINLLLFLGVLLAIIGVIRRRRQPIIDPHLSAHLVNSAPKFDDIIAVRQIHSNEPRLHPSFAEKQPPAQMAEPLPVTEPMVMFCLVAKDNKMLAGYELLQAILSVGLRFGEGQLFHKHQHNGQGPVLCTLAAATETGQFDLQAMGAFKVKGLCLFMTISGNSTIDAERFMVMLDIAHELSETLNIALLDDHQKPLTEERLKTYYHRLNIDMN